MAGSHLPICLHSVSTMYCVCVDTAWKNFFVDVTVFIMLMNSLNIRKLLSVIKSDKNANSTSLAIIITVKRAIEIFKLLYS